MKYVPTYIFLHTIYFSLTKYKNKEHSSILSQHGPQALVISGETAVLLPYFPEIPLIIMRIPFTTSTIF